MAASRARFTDAARSPMYDLKSNSVVAEAAAVATMAERSAGRWGGGGRPGHRGRRGDGEERGKVDVRGGQRVEGHGHGWRNGFGLGGGVKKWRDWRWPREVAISLS
ncbi:hypothetical protein PR202_gb21431 [Eleusine coracana subsp. coracana]|uniref:Uncharacterized protein n=1 Tax=Eleusine coracana subsp. coracana TaxID=191504 RepID=A0AAV5FEQ8_ELECO|nr:hypothetical protein PR202_gb21431 [Eleusine coracana subsp. coracana]